MQISGILLIPTGVKHKKGIHHILGKQKPPKPQPPKPGKRSPQTGENRRKRPQPSQNQTYSLQYSTACRSTKNSRTFTLQDFKESPSENTSQKRHQKQQETPRRTTNQPGPENRHTTPPRTGKPRHNKPRPSPYKL